MPTRHDLDQSAMYANLLELSPTYGRLESRAGTQVTKEALAAWYDSTGDDMFDFTKAWIKTTRKDLLPLRTGRSWSNRA